MERLVIRGARQHNLKNVTCDLPRNRLIAFTGPSGSGKSSLAFDTIYAEGQRLYVESLSVYARQFLERFAKPDVDAIEGLSPAIAIKQSGHSSNPRSTVGTVTEVTDYLRLLFARAGRPHCTKCGAPISSQSAEQIVDGLERLPLGTRMSLLAPIAMGRKGELRLEIERLRREGFARIKLDGSLLDLSDEIVLDGRKTHDLLVVVDRLVLREGIRGRLSDSVELALKLGDGMLHVEVPESDAPLIMSERFACVACGISLPPLLPKLFSFNSPTGACPTCEGLGSIRALDLTKIIPNPGKTLREGAIAAWGKSGSVSQALELDRAVRVLGLDPDVPFERLADSTREALLHGRRDGKRKASHYEGVLPKLAQTSSDADGDLPEEDDVTPPDAYRFESVKACPECRGTRLCPAALAVTVDDRTIADLGALPLSDLRAFLIQHVPTKESATVTHPLVAAMSARLGFLVDVGLGYLTLDRPSSTLSGGEGQRIRLATQIGSALVGVLYVLDEPSSGLHASDNERLLQSLERLVRLGNTVIVVEHDRETISRADIVVDLGPGAGVHGGEILAIGSPQEIAKNPKSKTGPYLFAAPERVAVRRTQPASERIEIHGARLHNLKALSTSIPKGRLTAVTGVSGSGKTSLIIRTLLEVARGARLEDVLCDRVTGIEGFDRVIHLDQGPIGRTPRSNAATFTGLFSTLREIFSQVPEARSRGYKSGRFSFNVKGGRCETCLGAGVTRVEMHFLPDLYVPCEACAGLRYNRETLEIRFHGRSIAEVLNLSVSEALSELESIPKIRAGLAALERVGLGYLKLGQPASTLSGGEAQRVKLARELAKTSQGPALYILDEPTSGLHFGDVDLLMEALFELRDAGHTVVVVEHNLDVIARADWMIEIGPGAGQDGGRVTYEGAPADAPIGDDVPTAAFLQRHFSRPASAAPKPNRSKSRGTTSSSME